MATDTNGFTPKSALKDLARAGGMRLRNVLVLAPQNDPYNCGSVTDRAQAEWLANLYHQHGFKQGTHLRRMHYFLVTLAESVLRHDGQTYENTELNWQYLQAASKAARYLGLISAEDLVDHRNPEPMIFAGEPRETPEPQWSIDEIDAWYIPAVKTELYAQFDLPDITVEGYDYDHGDQQYLVELWAEKNTMNDVLLPLCEEHGINLATSLGFQSITSVINLLQRVRSFADLNRPVRIFYISDFDPSGDCMPVAVARQIQFWMQKFGIEANVKLTPLVLTAEQVEQYDLPRKPIKETDGRKGKFEQRHGEGAVELDALEAIRPGELARIVEQAISPYRDDTLKKRLSDAEYEATTTAQEQWKEATFDAAADVRDLELRANAVFKKYRPELERIRDLIAADIAPIREEAETLEEEVRERFADGVSDIELQLPERPEVWVEPVDESDWLFDSTRSFFEQHDHFSRHKKGIR